VALRLGRSDGLVFPFVDYRWTEPSRSFQTVLRAGGLDAGTEYHAFIDVDGVQLAGPIPIWTAPPAGSATPLRLGFGSCTRDDSQPIFSAVADADLDAFFFVGDNHYGDTANLDALRWNYRWAHARPGRREFMSAVPTLAIWDDHDYVGNNTDGSAAGKATALRAFAESWPNPSFGEPGLDGVFFRWSWGEVDVFGLDDRYWRGEDGSVLGAPQTDWIVAELAASTATWKVVALGSQWTADGSNDSWASFLPARDALLTTLGDLGIAGIVFIDGDIHRTEIRSLDVAAFLG
jgi:alkaline phosphatase D